MIFQIDQLVTLRIPKENRATTDNHRLLCMIKEIPHEGRHRIKTKFGILAQLGSLMSFLQLINMPIDWTFKMLLLKQYLFMLWQRKLVQVTKLRLRVYAKNHAILGPDATVAKIRLNVHSIVIRLDEIVVMRVQ